METTKNLHLAPYIEQTLLKPEATETQIRKSCEEALKYSFKGVCVNSHFVPLVSFLLKNTPVLTVSVIGFPLGANLSEAKAKEAQLAVDKGAQELDMVINIGAAKENLWTVVEKDIQSVTKSVSVPVKVILETGLLKDDEIFKASQVAEQAGAHFVKTCTGFAPGGASVAHVQLMKKAISSQMKIKASGGIKTPEQAHALIEAGASRLGTSSGVSLVTGQVMGTSGY